MRSGKRLAFDVGEARIGVAMCDPDAILSTPVETLKRNGSDIRKALRIARDESVIEVIVGLPLNMDGTEGISAHHARRWAMIFAQKIAPIPVRLVDERLSTVTAHSQLHESGLGSRLHRDVVDQAAAIVILDSALEYERATGAMPGELVPSTKER